MADVLEGKRIAVVGVGAMGSALIRGLLQSKTVSPEQIFATDIDEGRLQAIRTLGVQVEQDNKTAVRACDVVLLCVKPQVMGEVLADIASVVEPQRHCIVSIAAGVPLARIEERLPTGTPVVRVMPNTPAQVLAGASAIALGTHALETHRQIAHAIFGAVGTVVDVPEKLLDAVTALSGSGPAYAFVFAEALADAGVHLGLPREVALKLAAQTLMGAAKMLLETGKHPGELKDMVTSPAGTTIAALRVLERLAFRGAVVEAVVAAYQRAKELVG